MKTKSLIAGAMALGLGICGLAYAAAAAAVADDAKTEKVTGVPSGKVAGVTKSPGAVIVGALSSTTIVTGPTALYLPPESYTRPVIVCSPAGRVKVWDALLSELKIIVSPSKIS